MQKINVLQFISPDGYYGAERWIMALAKNMDRSQVDCQLSVTHESASQNIEISKRFRLLGLESHELKMNGRFDPAIINKLCQLIKQKNIKIIHTHGYKSDILGLIAARLGRIKAITTPHGFENSKDIKLKMFMKLGGFSLRFFDRIVPLSVQLRDDLKKFQVPVDKIQLIINGVDLDEINNTGKKTVVQLKKHQDEQIIGYVGQISWRKNVSDLIKVFDEYYNEHKNCRLILIGDGPQRSELESYAAGLSSANNIEFLGYRNDRLDLVRSFDLFCMTSTLEGIPRAMMEAMAAGIPVAAYKIPGVDNLLIQGKTGLMADFGDIEQLKSCWEQLLLNDAYREKIAHTGKEYLIKHFSAKRMADEYINLYKELS